MCMTRSTRTGSIYLVTLVTVAAITSMILIGVSLRSTSSDQSAIVETMTESNTDLLNAAEYAIEKINADLNWIATAQKGVVFSPYTLGDSTIEGTVVDADTDALPTNTTTNYRVTLTSDNTIFHSSSQFVVNCEGSKVDYIDFLTKKDASFYWPMGEITGAATATDLIGTYDGTYLDPRVVGTDTNDEGGLVPVFANSNDSLEIPYGPLLIEAEGGVSLWMKSSNSDTFGINMIAGMLYASGGDPTFNLSSFGTTLTAYISEDGSFDLGKAVQTPGNVFTPNTWHHVMVTWGGDGLLVYVDGVLKGSNKSNIDGIGTARKINNGWQPFYIGSGYNLYSGSFPAPSRGFDGSIAHFAYFYKQLSSSKVEEIAAIRPDENNLLSMVSNSWVRVYE